MGKRKNKSKNRFKAGNQAKQKKKNYNTMATSMVCGNLTKFSTSKDDPNLGAKFTDWLERFENELIAWGIEDDRQKKALLISTAGDVAWEKWRTCTPVEKGDDKAYKTAKETLSEYFDKKRDPDFEITKFRECTQKQEQSIDAYVTELRALTRHCGFGERVDNEIKLQIKLNCASSRLRRKAFAEPQWKLDDLLKYARALEISNKQASEVESSSNNANTVKFTKARQATRGRQQRQHERRAPTSKTTKNTCGHCGYEYPHPGGVESCPASKSTCRNCQRKGHYERMCRQKKTTVTGIPTQFSRPYQRNNNGPRRSANSTTFNNSDGQPTTEDVIPGTKSTFSDDSDDDDPHFVYQAYGLTTNKLPKFEILIAGNTVTVTADTGSTCNIIDEETYQKINENYIKTKKTEVKLSNTTQEIMTYNSNKPLPLLGKFKAHAESKDKVIVTTFYVTKGNPGNLLSFNSCLDLKLIQVSNSINHAYTSGSINTDQIVNKYPEILEERIGKLKDYEVKLHINPDVKAVAQPHRRIPFHLRDKVEAEIRQLLEADVIEKVEGPTPWVSPIVVTPKPKQPDKIRMCVDMRAANAAIERERYITPTVDDIIGQVHGSSIFSKLDLRAGYHQLPLAQESRYITTFATHTGLYRYKRLSFGINAAAETFQHTISLLLADIPGAINISDDIIVFGKTQQDHNETLDKVLKKVSDNRLTLNAKKCEFNKTSLEFFGFIFSDGGMKPDPKKVEDIQNLVPPTNTKELRSILGMTGYSSRFIQDYATITAPLRELTHKNSTWSWMTKHQKAFDTLKEKLQSAPALAYFDMLKSTEILVDASPVGLGAILTQKDGNGDSHVIAYGSRSLTKTEQNYSQTEREALAIVWGCEHYHLYCYGKPLTVYTDHKPLTSIFSNPLSRPTPRIERWSLRLQPYQPTILYAPGPDNPADYSSRHPRKHTQTTSREEKVAEEYINFISQNATPIAIDLEEVKRETLNDHTLQRVIESIRNNNWHHKDSQDIKLDNKVFKSFQTVKDELSVNAEGNLVLRGTRLVMPESLQNRSVDIAHEGHQGMAKTKAMIREKVWFPFIDTLIEDKINSCLACQAVTKQPIREPLQMSRLPDEPWLEISADLCGPLPSGQHLLVVIDDYSRFPEVEVVHSTSADAVIPHLDNIISRHQIPAKIRTDNGSPFNSESFSRYVQHMGIKHRKITPLWPEANGLCERFMRNIKRICTTAKVEHKNWRQELNIFLRNYRATPHSSTGVPPHTALYGRPMRTKLPEVPLNLPKDKEMRIKDQRSKDVMKKYADQRRHTKPSSLRPDDEVLVHKGKAHQRKTEPYYEPHPYTVIDKKGSMVTASDGQHSITRNSSMFKHVKLEASTNLENNDQDADIDILETSPAETPVNPDMERDTQERRYPLRTTRGQPPQALRDFVLHH